MDEKKVRDRRKRNEKENGKIVRKRNGRE